MLKVTKLINDIIIKTKSVSFQSLLCQVVLIYCIDRDHGETYLRGQEGGPIISRIRILG